MTTPTTPEPGHASAFDPDYEALAKAAMEVWRPGLWDRQGMWQRRIYTEEAQATVAALYAQERAAGVVRVRRDDLFEVLESFDANMEGISGEYGSGDWRTDYGEEFTDRYDRLAALAHTATREEDQDDG